jgi:hypothetical protein
MMTEPTTSPVVAFDPSSPAGIVDTPTMSLLTASAEPTTIVAPPDHSADDHLVQPLPLAEPTPPTAAMMMMRSSAHQTTPPIATSCFLLDHDEPLLFPSSMMAPGASTNNPGNSTSIAHGNNLNKKKNITDSMSFSLFSMELDEILLDDPPTNRQHHNNQISSRDTLSLQESILCGSWRDRLLTTDEDDNEGGYVQDDYFYNYYQRSGCVAAGNASSSSSGDGSSIWSESICSR